MTPAKKSESVDLPGMDAGTAATDIDRTERSNILVLVLHQILFRTAWIFKTESVIIPAFLDTITDSGWIRGLLPPLNRFGQSLAPLLLSDRLSRSSLKKRWLARTTGLMSLPFLALGALLTMTVPSSLMVLLFLSSYLLFFCMTGVNQTAFNTIQGKLVRPQHRGRLIAAAGYVGSPVAVTTAWLLLRPWTQAAPPKYANIFLFTGAVFFVASLTVRRLCEVPDPEHEPSPINIRGRFADAGNALRRDHHLRRLCVVAALFVCSQALFPHYQRLGQIPEGFRGEMFMVWVIAQNLSAAFFSWMSGWLADARGTRAALRWLTFFALFAPPVALMLSKYASAQWYWLTYVLLGAVPVTYRMFLNYALELTERFRHPIYVSTVVLCMAPPILLSPVVGEAVQQLGYRLPFLGISLILLSAWGLSLKMIEPRQLQ